MLLNVGMQPLAGPLDMPALALQLPAVLMPVHPALGKDCGCRHDRSSQNEWQKPPEINSNHRFLLKLRRSCFCCVNPWRGEKSRFFGQTYYPAVFIRGPEAGLRAARGVKESESVLYDGKGRAYERE